MYASYAATIILSLSSCSFASPISKRDEDKVVQGALGTDEYWNDYDGGINHYTEYTGNGSSIAGWPKREDWISFNDMWIASQPTLQRSCNNLYKVPNNSEDEIKDIYESIKRVAHITRVDHRFILAALMQETKGCVRAETSKSPDGIVNPGMLQTFKGTFSCNMDGKVQTPCPKDTIQGMILEGIAGTDAGHGFAVDINLQQDVPDVEFAEAYYRGARLYNSGAIDDSGDLGKGGATHCYASDIANRLTGWVDANHTCTLDDENPEAVHKRGVRLI